MQGTVADPINVAVGNLIETETDYAGKIGDDLPLRIERTYNSLSGARGIFGNSWSSNLDTQASLNIAGTSLTVRLSNGQLLPFAQSSGVWVSASTFPVTLIANAGGYLLSTYDKHQYQFNTAGQLTALTNAQGERQTYQYVSNQLTSVTDNVGNVLSLTYNANGLVDTITVAGQSIHYIYNTTTTTTGFKNLTSVTYPATSGAGTVTRQYLYENTQFPWALTGLIDETNKRVSTWGYSAQGLANSNNRAGSENFTIDYSHINDAPDPYSLVTNAKNYSWKYHLQTGSDGMVRVVRVEGLGTANCAAASNYTSYDSAGHAITVTDGNGNATLRHYTANGLVDQETQGYQWSGGIVTGNVSNLIETATMRKQVVTAWDATNTWPTTIIYSGKDLNGSWLQYQRENRSYDTHGRLQNLTLTDLTNFTDPYPTYGNTRSWRYSYTYYDGAQTKINTLIAQGPGGVNDLTTSTYDQQGRLIQVAQKVNATLSLTTAYSQFNTAGLPQRVIDPNNVPTQMNYDPRNRLHQIVRNVGASGGQTTTLDYYDNGLLKRTTLADGSWLNYTYADGVHLSRLDDNAGNYVLLTPGVLDGQWAQRRVFDNTGTLKQTQNRVFDDLGRLLKVLDASGSVAKSSYSYDLGGNLYSSEVGTDVTTAIVRNYDALNRLKQLDAPENTHSQYRYDAQGHLTKITDPRGLITQYTYDGLGNLMKQQSPDSGLTKFWYDAAGNLTQKTDARGIVSTYTYDALNRLKTITYPASTAENVTFTYDDDTAGNYGMGHLYYTYVNGSTLSYTYDAYGNTATQINLTSNGWYTVSYLYDIGNRVRQIAYPTGRIVKYTRNSLGQITQVQTKANATATLQTLVSNVAYEPFGPLKSVTFANGVTTTIGHDADYRVSRMTTTSIPVWDFMYGYDAAGNILSIADQNASAPYSKAYTYDNLNRVLTDVAASGNNQYQYDANGNRTLWTSGAYQMTQSYSATRNRQTQFGGYGGGAVVSDAAGNITAKSNWYTAQYNNANRMSQTPDTSYQYNGLGQRLFKLGAQRTYYGYAFDGKYLTGLTLNADNSFNKSSDYVWLDDTPIAQIKSTYGANNAITSSTLTYIHADHLNTPRAMTDATKKIVWRWESGAYGTTYPTVDPDGDGVQTTLDLRFPGQIVDDETGLFYNMNRYYDPLSARYLQSDPIGLAGGLNTYAYVEGNPISFIDPLGLDKTIWRPLGPGRNTSDGPRNGNWGGGNWSGGVSGGGTGSAPALDSGDECYQHHDQCYDSGTSKSSCDKKLVDELKGLPNDPQKWPRPPAPGTEGDSDRFRRGAIIIFGR